MDTHKHSINAQLFPKTLDMVEIGRTRVRPLFRRRNDKTVMEREMKLTSFYCFYVFISDIYSFHVSTILCHYCFMDICQRKNSSLGAPAL